MIIAGLASVIIGEVLVGTSSVSRTIIAVICGSLIYRVVIALVLQLGLAPTDLKLITSIIVIVFLISPNVRTKLFARKSNLMNGREVN